MNTIEMKYDASTDKQKTNTHKKNIEAYVEMNDHLRYFYQNSGLIFRAGAQRLLQEHKNEIFEWDHLPNISMDEFEYKLHSKRSPVFLRNVFIMIFNGVKHKTKKKKKSSANETITQSDVIQFMNGYKCVNHISRISAKDILWLFKKMNEMQKEKSNESNANQIMDCHQFGLHLSSLQLSAERLKCLFNDIDIDMDGEITLGEYYEWQRNLETDKLKLLLNSVTETVPLATKESPQTSVDQQLEIDFQGW